MFVVLENVTSKPLLPAEEMNQVSIFTFIKQENIIQLQLSGNFDRNFFHLLN